ncbi:hypothetical protein RINTHM_4010 [Richelia intracellularis HM01]|nr:hypothetical protein RINTHM_4010 [Richelia intracellularis HM01]
MPIAPANLLSKEICEQVCPEKKIQQKKVTNLPNIHSY